RAALLGLASHAGEDHQRRNDPHGLNARPRRFQHRGLFCFGSEGNAKRFQAGPHVADLRNFRNRKAARMTTTPPSPEHFETSSKKVGRGMSRRSLDLIEAMYDAAEAAEPITGRGIGYKLFTAGLIPSMAKPEMQRVYRLLKVAREQ